MDREGIELRGRTALEQDWLTLLYCGRNGIGHLDVFADDSAAERYYARAANGTNDFSVLPAVARFATGQATVEETELVFASLGATAGIPGAQPKILLRDWLIKIDNPAYPGLLALEELAYQVHRRAGFEVPESRLVEIDGLRFLATRRFDRVEGTPVPVESFFAIWAARDPRSYRCNTDGSVEFIAHTMRSLGCTDTVILEWFGRFVLSLLTLNGDLHSENISLMAGERPRLSPIYDPAPMRYYRGRENHDLLSALPFDGIGGVASGMYRPYADSGGCPSDLRMRLLKVGLSAGLTEEQANSEIHRMLELTEDFLPRAALLLRECLPPGYQGRAPDITETQKTLLSLRVALLQHS